MHVRIDESGEDVLAGGIDDFSVRAGFKIVPMRVMVSSSTKMSARYRVVRGDDFAVFDQEGHG